MNHRLTTSRQATLPSWTPNSTDALTVEAAPVGGEAPAGGGGARPNGAAGEGENAPAPFYEAFKSEALRTSPSVQLFKDVEALAEGYVSLEKRFGVDPNRRLELPADPKDVEGMRKVFARLGAPEKADGYGFSLAKEANDADKAMLAAFTTRAHELMMPTTMAKGVMDFWLEQVAAGQESENRANAQRVAEGQAALRAEWGAAYPQRLREIGTMVAKYGDEALVKELDETKIGNYPNLAKLLGKLVERMAEPGSIGDRNESVGDRGGLLTPSQATAQAKALETHPALRDKNHPQHKAIVAERDRLLTMAETPAP
jgi:hypothetical protein